MFTPRIVSFSAVTVLWGSLWGNWMQNLFLSLNRCNIKTRLFYFATKLIFIQNLWLRTYYHQANGLTWSSTLSINSQKPLNHRTGLIHNPPSSQESHIRPQTWNLSSGLLMDDLKILNIFKSILSLILSLLGWQRFTEWCQLVTNGEKSRNERRQHIMEEIRWV